MKGTILTALSTILFIIFIVIVVKIILLIITYFYYIIFGILGLLVLRYTIILIKNHRKRIHKNTPPKENYKKEYKKVLNEVDKLFNNWETNTNIQTKNKI